MKYLTRLDRLIILLQRTRNQIAVKYGVEFEIEKELEAAEESISDLTKTLDKQLEILDNG